MNIPELNEGEIYAGAIINKDGVGHHVILLAGDKDDGPWQEAMDWAKNLGGDLPNRVEQALLFDGCKAEFKEDWYWSNTTHKNNAEWAWCQDFGNGYQVTTHKGRKLRARAVRRLPI